MAGELEVDDGVAAEVLCALSVDCACALGCPAVEGDDVPVATSPPATALPVATALVGLPPELWSEAELSSPVEFFQAPPFQNAVALTSRACFSHTI